MAAIAAIHHDAHDCTTANVRASAMHSLHMRVELLAVSCSYLFGREVVHQESLSAVARATQQRHVPQTNLKHLGAQAQCDRVVYLAVCDNDQSTNDEADCHTSRTKLRQAQT